jgi:hypothetical protein
MLQEPWKKQELTIATGGEEGTGKTLIFELIGRLVGPHYIHLQSEDDLVGQFTSARNNKIMVFLDECYLCANRKDADALRNLITGKEERVREMRKDPSYQKSFSQICLTSNFDHFIPATEKARRFLCLLSCFVIFQNKWYQELFPSKDPSEYFDELERSLLDNDMVGLKTLMNFLLNLPVRNFKPTKIPMTGFLAKQKLSGLPPLKKWWVEVLKRGWHQSNAEQSWLAVAEELVLFEDFKVYANSREKKSYSKDINNLPLWLEEFKKLVPQKWTNYIRHPITGEILKKEKMEVPFQFNASVHYNGSQAPPTTVHKLNIAPLAKCEKRFNQVVPGAKFYFLPQKPLNELMADRCRNMSADEIVTWAPQNFYGVNLRKQLAEGTFKITREADLDRYWENPQNAVRKSNVREKTKYAFMAVNERLRENYKQNKPQNMDVEKAAEIP